MGVRRVEVPTAPLLEVTSPENDLEVAGAYVKVMPRLSAAERMAYDGAAVAAEVRARGARGVVVSPEVDRDAGAARHEVPPAVMSGPERRNDPGEAIRNWIQRSAAAPEIRGRAQALADEVLAAAGIR